MYLYVMMLPNPLNPKYLGCCTKQFVPHARMHSGYALLDSLAADVLGTSLVPDHAGRRPLQYT